MIDILSSLLKTKFNYELEDYAIYEIQNGKNNIRLISIVLFVVTLLLYGLNVLEVFENFMSLVMVIGSFALFILIPFVFIKSKYDAIIVTPKYIIQRVTKSDFVVIEFDAITGFKIADDGIIIRENSNKIVLCTNLFQEEVEPIIEILEAKGKTFDKKKDYMIRKIDIIIQDNKVSIEDIEEVTESDKIYMEYHEDFPHLTPGFINEIMFRNSEVEDVLYSSGNVFLYLNTLEVKGGHPENTTFDNLKANDCIVVFEKMKFNKFYKENLNDKAKPKTDLSLDTEEASELLNNAVIHEWKNSDRKMRMSFASGVYMLHADFTYDEVVIGWKEAK